jgi:hypothetical protein
VSRRTPPAGATRPAALACRPRQRLARGRASRPQAARPSNRDFAATQGRRPGSPAGSAPDPRWACRPAIKGPSNWPRAHSRKRECRSRLLRRAPGADRLPECEPPPTVRSAPITVAMPGRIFLETPAMGAQSIFSVSAKHVYWTVRQLGRPAARLSTSFRTVPYGPNDVQSCQGFALDVALLDRVVARRGVREYKNFPNTQFELRSKM